MNAWFQRFKLKRLKQFPRFDTKIERKLLNEHKNKILQHLT